MKQNSMLGGALKHTAPDRFAAADAVMGAGGLSGPAPVAKPVPVPPPVVLGTPRAPLAGRNVVREQIYVTPEESAILDAQVAKLDAVFYRASRGEVMRAALQVIAGLSAEELRAVVHELPRMQAGRRPKTRA